MSGTFGIVGLEGDASTFFDPDQRHDIGGRHFCRIPSNGPQGEHVFYDWESDRNATGEPRTDDAHTEFNKTISHVVLDNPGYGYSMPT